MRAVVIGGGVIGLTTAIRLAECGHEVRIRCARRWPQTVSAVAAAIWYPFRAYPPARVRMWSRTTFEVLRQESVAGSAAIAMLDGRVFWRAGEDPGLSTIPAGSDPLDPARLPAGYHHGATTRVPRVEMPLYLAELERRFLEMGGTIEERAVASLAEAAALAPLVVNCSGLGAARLVPDAEMVAIRGQIVRVANPGITAFTLDAGEHDEDISYVIPRTHDVVLGGTATVGAGDPHPDPEVARRILTRCTALEPALADAPVLGHAVGLRPGRPAIRLEREELPGAGLIVHNYGHGGSGVTLSWGCAEAVVGLVDGETPSS